MKHFLPEACLMFFCLAFTSIYIDVCVAIFNYFYAISSFEIFKKTFLAFPLLTLSAFTIIGYLRTRKIHDPVLQIKINGSKKFLRENLILFVVAFAVFFQIHDALNEVDLIFPYWYLDRKKFDIFVDLIGMFCLSVTTLHFFILIKNLFEHRGKNNDRIA